jgi:hypothetical protein
MAVPRLTVNCYRFVSSDSRARKITPDQISEEDDATP